MEQKVGKMFKIQLLMLTGQSFIFSVTATGGTLTTVDTNFKIHTFTGPGTFTVNSAGILQGSMQLDYLVVAGGGGGGKGRPCWWWWSWRI